MEMLVQLSFAILSKSYNSVYLQYSTAIRKVASCVLLLKRFCAVHENLHDRN